MFDSPAEFLRLSSGCCRLLLLGLSLHQSRKHPEIVHQHRPTDPQLPALKTFPPHRLIQKPVLENPDPALGLRSPTLYPPELRTSASALDNWPRPRRCRSTAGWRERSRSGLWGRAGRRGNDRCCPRGGCPGQWAAGGLVGGAREAGRRGRDVSENGQRFSRAGW